MATRARWFEERGVVDRAAALWLACHSAAPDPAKLQHAAELWEQALDSDRAERAYRALAKFPAYRAAAKKALSELDIIDPAADRDPGVYEVLGHAEQLIRTGKLEAALQVLGESPLTKTDTRLLERMGTLHWRLAEPVQAQLYWAKARTLSGPIVMGLGLQALPAFWQNTNDLLFDGESLLIAAANRELFGYDPNLRHFSRTGSTLDQVNDGHFGDVPLEAATLSVARFSEMFGNRFNAVASPDGRALAWLSEAGMLSRLDLAENGVVAQTWQIATDATREAFNEPDQGRDFFVPGLAFSEDSQRIYVGSVGGRVLGFDRRGKLAFKLSAHATPIVALAAAPNGQWLASVSRDLELSVWNLTNRKRVAELSLDQVPTALSFFPNSETVEATLGRRILRFDWRTRQKTAEYHGDAEIVRVDRSASGLFTAIGQAETHGIDLLEGSSSAPFHIATGQVFQCFSDLAKDGQQLALGGDSGVFHLTLAPWRVRRLTPEGVFSTTRAVAISPDGAWVAAAHWDKVRVYSRTGGAAVYETQVSGDDQGGMAFVDKDELGVIDNGALRIVKVDTGKNLMTWPNVDAYLPLARGGLRRKGHTLEVVDKLGKVQASMAIEGEAFASNRPGTTFAYTSAETRNIVLSDPSGEPHLEVRYFGRSQQLAIADAETTIAVYGGGGLHLWQAETGWVDISATVHRGLSGVTTLQFFGDEWLLVGGSDGMLAYDIEQGAWSGGLHLQKSGAWFSITRQGDTTRVDGDAAAIDTVVLSDFWFSPGLVWEGFRSQGSFAAMLRGTLDAEFGWEP